MYVKVKNCENFYHKIGVHPIVRYSKYTSLPLQATVTQNKSTK